MPNYRYNIKGMEAEALELAKKKGGIAGFFNQARPWGQGQGECGVGKWGWEGAEALQEGRHQVGLFSARIPGRPGGRKGGWCG